MKNIRFITCISLAAVIFSCSTGKQNLTGTAAKGEEGNAIALKASGYEDGTGRQFWNALFTEVCNASARKNVCISPLSAQLALSMTAAGAEGETQEQMYAAMGVKGNVNALSKELVDGIVDGGKECEVKIANSIWINKKLAVKSSFVEANKEYFDADVESLPFNEEAAAEINGWCSEKTNGKIESIIGKINKDDMMYLVNALYFKGAWKDQFASEATATKPFTTEDGRSVDAEMMHQHIRTTYYEDSIMQVAYKPFKERYSMMLVLPAEGVSMESLFGHLAGYDLSSRMGKVVSLELSMPKFRSEFSTSLKQALKDMGIERAFSPDAQFGGISKEPLCINDVIQKTFINVDENGAEAAAVTAVSMMLGSAMVPEKKSMNLNRPFLYIIMDYNANILFVGKVGDPAEK